MRRARTARVRSLRTFAGRVYRRRSAAVFVLVLCSMLVGTAVTIADRHLMREYRSLESRVTYDRDGTVLKVEQNARDQVSIFLPAYPDALTRAVLAKEDQWFYYHAGIHPYRIASVLVARLRGKPSGGASTITQQLAKTLLGTTNERTIVNKLREVLAASVLEYRHNKHDIRTMYLNTVPLGGNVQGFGAAARYYFDSQVSALSESETLALVATLSKPNTARPYSKANDLRASSFASVLGLRPPVLAERPVHEESGIWLELESLRARARAQGSPWCEDCRSTLDSALTENIRSLLARALLYAPDRGMTHGAVVVIDAHTNELIAIVGSPDPAKSDEGMRINMALETRPVGSTIKPFIYLAGFAKGLRPYTEVSDREYSFAIDNGFPLYPKNYDGAYRGTVTLEEALANSLNVPTVEVLRFVGLADFYRYAGDTVGFTPAQPWETYAYGIALGGLELDLLTLTHAFTAFAREGVLAPLVTEVDPTGNGIPLLPPHENTLETRRIGEAPYVALVNSILTDRTAGVEQFGQKGSLTLSRPGYAVKTGTSRDYHDSWTVGYTGDYVVGVWVGNAENTPMKQITGAHGAGSIWHDVMELMYTTPYWHGTPLSTEGIVRVQNSRGFAYGLPGDEVEEYTSAMAEQELILFPHAGDVFLYTPGMRIPVTPSERVLWQVNGAPLTPIRDGWYPDAPGTFVLTATNEYGETESIELTIQAEPTPLPN